MIQWDDYYPFGLTFNSYQRVTGKENKYLFNGIERQTELDLGWDLAEFRSYSPELGRWHQIDPKASERESPYVGFANNPILFADPLGDTVITTMVNGKEVQFENRSVNVHTYTVAYTETGYLVKSTGSRKENRVKSSDSESNNWQGDAEYEYTVFEKDATESKIISSQSEQSVGVPGIISENYDPYSEDLARAYEGTGDFLQLGGDSGAVGATLLGNPVGATLGGVASSLGVGMNIMADFERSQNDAGVKKGATAIATEVGARALEKKSKSNYVKALYIAVSSFLGDLIND